MRTRRLLTGIAMAASLAVCIPLGATPTLASWTDAEWTEGQIGTATVDCGNDTGYVGESSGQFLSGNLLGLDLSTVAEVEGVDVGLTDSSVSVTPSSAIAVEDTAPRYTYVNPLNVNVLSGILPLNLTGLAVPLPGLEVGAVNQFSRVSEQGEVVGASGLVNDSGGVLVSETPPGAELPQHADVSLMGLLPGVEGIADVGLQVGAVGATAEVDGCELLREQVWGAQDAMAEAPAAPRRMLMAAAADPSDVIEPIGVVRDYGVAGLALEIDSPLVGSLVGVVDDAVDDLDSAVQSLVGKDGLISTLVSGVLLNSLGDVVSGLGLGGITGDVAIRNLKVAETIDALILKPRSSGGVSLDLGRGIVSVDIDALVGQPLNGAAPNTELLLNDTIVNQIVTTVMSLLDTFTNEIVTGVRVALGEATLDVDLLVDLTLLRVGAELEAKIGCLVSPDPLCPTVSIDLVLDLLGLPLGWLLNPLLAGLVAPLLNGIVNLLTTTLFGVVDNLFDALSKTVTSIVSALSVVLTPLPNAVSLMVNVQPDQPGAPIGWEHPADPRVTGKYQVSALRLGLLDVLGGGLLYVHLGTASAGPISRL